MKIDGNTMAVDALKIKGVVEVFKKYDLYCIKCKGMVQETIDKICFNKHLSRDEFIEELNKAANNAK